MNNKKKMKTIVMLSIPFMIFSYKVSALSCGKIVVNHWHSFVTKKTKHLLKCIEIKMMSSCKKLTDQQLLLIACRAVILFRYL